MTLRPVESLDEERAEAVRVLPVGSDIDVDAAERAVRHLLRALGVNTDAPHSRETPRRVADMYAELLTPKPFRLTTFLNHEGYDELVVARSIPVHSLCEHHLLP